MKVTSFCVLSAMMLVTFHATATDVYPAAQESVSKEVIAQQRQDLDANTKGQGFGPQSPRDIDSFDGSNTVRFSAAPPYSQMNLCNVHFHKNAEHKGGEFAKYAGTGDGHGHSSGYLYSGRLTEAELSPVDYEVCSNKHGGLYPGDTIEVHYVCSSAQVGPGPGLGSCLNDATKNPQLRVEAQVYVVVNDEEAGDFVELAKYGKLDGFHQALNIPDDTGTPVQYTGSTTGPSYNKQGSPFQVTWSVRPKVAKVDVESLGMWCESNVFDEDHAHGVRNLVINRALLSEIKQ